MSSDCLGLITTDPAVLSGQAVIAGTRVPGSVVLDPLSPRWAPNRSSLSTDADRAQGMRAAPAYGPLLARWERVPSTPG